MSGPRANPTNRNSETGRDTEYASQPGPTLIVVFGDTRGGDYSEEIEAYGFTTRTDLARTLELLPAGPGDVLVDWGCGRGGTGLWLARETADLIGIDLQEMGDVFRAAIEEAKRGVADGLGDRSDPPLNRTVRYVMKKATAVAMALLLPFLVACCSKSEDMQVTNHDSGPQNAQELPPELLRKMEEIRNSPYYRHVQSLKQPVVGRRVVKTEAGTSGFVLYLDDQKWVMACLDEGKFRWRMGEGALGESERVMLNSPLFGDASMPIPGNVPYADQTCDFSAEVAKTLGKQITGLSYGERTFNFCFSEKRELDVNLRQDAEGRLAYRVYWEQW